MAGGDYGRIRHTFWTDPDVKRRLTPEQKTLLLYWFTSPHGNLAGVFCCPMEYAAAETGIPIEDVRAWTFGALSGFVSYDEETEEIFVHAAGKHQVGDDLKATDLRVKAIRKALAEIHSKPLRRAFLVRYSGWPLGIEVPPEPDPVEKSGTPHKHSDSEAPSKPLDKPLRSHSSAVAVHSSNSAVHADGASKPEPPTGGQADERSLAIAEMTPVVEAFAEREVPDPRKRKSFVATARGIVAGEDRTAWEDGRGEPAPWPDRPRLLRLALDRVAAGESDKLRGALRWVVPQQLDPDRQRPAIKGEATPYANSPPATSAPADPLAEQKQLEQEHPQHYAEALAELEGYRWWAPMSEMEKVRELRNLIREKIKPKVAIVR